MLKRVRNIADKFLDYLYDKAEDFGIIECTGGDIIDYDPLVHDNIWLSNKGGASIVVSREQWEKLPEEAKEELRQQGFRILNNIDNKS